jgi:hypothetical protein
MDVVNLPWGAPSLQTIAVQQQDGREDTAGSFLHESAQAIKYFSERIPFSHHLENPFLHGDQGFCALAVFDINSGSTRPSRRRPSISRRWSWAATASRATSSSADGDVDAAKPRPVHAHESLEIGAGVHDRDIHGLADLLRLRDRRCNDQLGFIHCHHDSRTPDRG